MTPQERKALAESILGNPLIEIILSELETAAIDRCINADMRDEVTRSAAAAETRAIRAFRGNLAAMLQDNHPRKGAPA